MTYLKDQLKKYYDEKPKTNVDSNGQTSSDDLKNSEIDLNVIDLATALGSLKEAEKHFGKLITNKSEDNAQNDKKDKKGENK